MFFLYFHDILQAIELYSKAIELNPTNAVYYANRSISHLRLENYGYALADASRAIETDKTYLKAYYRFFDLKSQLMIENLLLQASCSLHESWQVQTSLERL